MDAVVSVTQIANLALIHAEVVGNLVERDSPFYDPVISEDAVIKLNSFAQSVGLLPGPVPYEQVVAVRFRDLWTSPHGSG